MTNVVAFKLSLNDLHSVTGLQIQTLLNIVEHGIVDPEGSSPKQWLFDRNIIPTIRKAYRLHNDLGIDWAGIALAMDLLNEMDQLRKENRLLRRQLQRFHNE